MALTAELKELIAFLAPLVAEEDDAPSEAKAATSQQWQALAKNLDDARQALEEAAAALTAASGSATREDSKQRFQTGAESAHDRAQWVEDLRDRARVYARRAPSEGADVPETPVQAAELRAAVASAEAAEATAKAEKAKLREAQDKAQAAQAELRTQQNAERAAHLQVLRAELELAEQRHGAQQGTATGAPAEVPAEIQALRDEIQRELSATRPKTSEESTEPAEPTGWPVARKRLMAAQSGVETARQKLGRPQQQDDLARSFVQDLDLEAEMILVLRRRLESVSRHG